MLVELPLIRRSRNVLYGVAYALLLGVLYSSTYTWLVMHDWVREDYNYCYLIPFVVLFLIWEKRHEWMREAPVQIWGGVPVVMIGLLMYWFGELAGEYFTSYLSSWLIVAGLFLAHNGWKRLKIMLFPLFVALFLFPLPNFLNTKLTLSLKLLSSEIGVKIIQLTGMSAFRDGNLIDLGFTQLQVVDACSGLRYLIPLFLMGILVAHYYRAAVWKRILVALTTIPLSVLTNSMRIAMTAFLFPTMGRAAAEGFFHDFSGWVIFIISFAALVAEIGLLKKIIPCPGEGLWISKKSSLELSAIRQRTDDYGGSAARGALFAHLQFIVIAVMLAASLSVHLIVDFRDKTPIVKPFSSFPLAVGDWRGERQPIEQQFLEILDFTDYVQVNYVRKDSMPINFYVAYYASQRKGKSIHSPETCLPGGGWVLRDTGKRALVLNGHPSESVTVMRAVMEKGASRQLVYFWFKQRGRILTNAYEMKIFNALDAITSGRSDGALIRIITPISSIEQAADADRRIESFLHVILPMLKEFIPD